MEITQLDYVLVPCGLLVLAVYHGWLLLMIVRKPELTVIGLDRQSRHQWVYCLTNDPLKNGTLAVQSIRNNMMATTPLATISITLSSLISAFVSSSDSSSDSSSWTLLSMSTKTFTVHTFKYFAILLCFLLAFFCYLQCTRYCAHVSFLITLPSAAGKKEHIEYVAQKLNRGSTFWSLGLRAFYLSFPLMLWIFGPIPMFLCCCCMTFMLYFLKMASSLSRQLYQAENNGTQAFESMIMAYESILLMIVPQFMEQAPNSVGTHLQPDQSIPGSNHKFLAPSVIQHQIRCGTRIGCAVSEKCYGRCCVTTCTELWYCPLNHVHICSNEAVRRPDFQSR
ncbi:hypothetical protein Drorol1_Dr00004561 [Drosera rotundifolia]